MLQVLTLDRFNGGQSSDIKEGPKSAFWYSRHFDFRKAPSKISVLPRTVKQTGNIYDLIVAIEQVADGSWYMVGNAGYVYKRATNGTISNFGQITGDTIGYGMFYRRDQDAIIITGGRDIHEISPINNPNVSPTLKISKYAASKSVDSGATATGGAATYTTPTSVTESANDIRSFVSDIEPLYSIKVKVVARGSGDWTLTLHDAENNLLASSTVANGSLSNGTLNEFVFSSPVRLLVKPNGRTYHFHLTSTVADGTAQVTSANNLSTADYEIWANRLVPTTSGFHPAGVFLQYNMFGNGRYLAQWEPLSNTPSNLEFLRHKLTLPDGYEITSMVQWQQYWAMGAEKRAASGVFQDGKIFLWDGTAQTYNDYVNVPQGSPYSLYTDEAGILNFYAANSHYQFAGGNQATKVRTFRNTDSEYSQAQDVTVAYPNMMTTRRSVLLMAYPSSTTNPNLEYGVRSYGQTDKNYAKVFGFSYSISPGTLLKNATNNLLIGCIKNTGDTLFLSWREDDTASDYGLDIVDNFSTPFGSAVLESLIFDNGKVWKRKNADALKLQVPVLPAGCSVRLGWQINRSGSFTYSSYLTTAGELYYGFAKKSFREIQFRIEVVVPTDGSVTTSLEITAFSFQFDDLEKENRFK